MNLVLQIVLVICCIGVTYSSPTSITGKDAVSSEKLPKVNSELPADHNKNDSLTPSSSAKPMEVVPGVQPVKGAVIVSSAIKEEAVMKENKNNTKGPDTISGHSGIIDATNITTDNKNVSSAKSTVPIPSLQENNSSTSTPPQAAVSAEKSKGNTTAGSLTPAPTPAPASVSTEKSKGNTTAGSLTPAPTPAPASVSTEKSKVTAQTLSVTTPLAAKADKVMPEPKAQERQFDSPSFIGGIVLTVGLTAIGFIAFKFYKSGTVDRNYRTL